MIPKEKEETGLGSDRIGRSEYDIIECALRNDFQGVDRALKENPLHINAQREGSGITPLIAASGRGLGRMVDHLLTKPGVDLHIKDDFGRSALDHARTFPDIVAKLVTSAHPTMKWQEPNIKPA